LLKAKGVSDTDLPSEAAQPFCGDKVGTSGAEYQFTYHEIRIEKDKNSANQYRDHRSDNMPTEFFEMIDKGHLAGLAGISSVEKAE
jgi:hypothetical protein